MKEKIVLAVTIEICYEDKDGRKEAMKHAKDCVLSTTVHATNGAKPIKSKVIKL